MPLLVPKDTFLANKSNKSRFIKLLTSHLEESGCTVRQAEDDADFLITIIALQLAENGVTTVIGDDTDLLVLLCYHFNENTPDNNIYFKSELKSGATKLKMWDIRRTTEILGCEMCTDLLYMQ